MHAMRRGNFRGIAAAVVLTASTLSNPAWPAQWQPVVVTTNGSIFLDVQSIEKRGDRILGRVMRHAIKPRLAGGDADLHESDILLVNIDCAAGTVGAVPANSTSKQFSGNPDPMSYTNAGYSLDPVRTLACDPVALAASLPK